MRISRGPTGGDSCLQSARGPLPSRASLAPSMAGPAPSQARPVPSRAGQAPSDSNPAIICAGGAGASSDTPSARAGPTSSVSQTRHRAGSRTAGATHTVRDYPAACLCSTLPVGWNRPGRSPPAGLGRRLARPSPGRRWNSAPTQAKPTRREFHCPILQRRPPLAHQGWAPPDSQELWPACHLPLSPLRSAALRTSVAGPLLGALPPAAATAPALPGLRRAYGQGLRLWLPQLAWRSAPLAWPAPAPPKDGLSRPATCVSG